MADVSFTNAKAIPNMPGTTALRPSLDPATPGTSALLNPSVPAGRLTTLDEFPSTPLSDVGTVPKPQAAPAEPVTTDVRAPDGTLIKVKHPAGASPDQIKAFAQQQWTPQTEEGLGVIEEFSNMFDRSEEALNIAADAVFGAGSVDHLNRSLGLPTTAEEVASRQKFFEGEEKRFKPGEMGKFGADILAGEVLGVGKIAAAGRPLLSGAVTGALISHGKNWEENAIDIVLSALGAKYVPEGLAIGKRALSRALSSTADVRSRAVNYVIERMQASGKTVDEIRDFTKKMFGKPFTAAEALGEQTVNDLGRIVKAGSAQGAKLFARALDARDIQTGERFLSDVKSVTGIDPVSAKGNMETIVAEGEARAEQLKKLAFDAPPPVTPKLNAMLADKEVGPVIQQAMKNGVKIDALEHAAEGIGNPNHPPFEHTPYGTTGWKRLPFPNRRGPYPISSIEPVLGPTPTWRTWHAAVEGLDHMINTTFRDAKTGLLKLEGNTPEAAKARFIYKLRNDLVAELERANPAYARYLQETGGYMEAKNAYATTARALFDSKVSTEGFAQAVGQLSKTGRDAMRAGVINILHKAAQDGTLDLDMGKIAGKLALAFGPEQADALIQRAEAEAELKAGSKSLRTPYDDAKATPGERKTELNNLLFDIGRVIIHGKLGLYKAAAGWLLKRVLPRLQEDGFEKMSPEMRDEVGKLLMMSPDHLAAAIEKRPDTLERLNEQIRQLQRSVSVAPAVAATKGADAAGSALGLDELGEKK